MSGPRRATRALLILLAAAVSAALLSAVTASAAVAKTHPVGYIDSVKQAANGNITVTGWAFDPGKPTADVRVGIYVDGHYAAWPMAYHPRPDVDRAYHITGKHGLNFTFPWKGRAYVVRVWARPLVGTVHPLIGTKYPNGVSSPGARIIAEARKFVGKTRYVYGGTSPKTGFDCSGYTQYVYRVTKVAALPRTAEQQRHAKGMHIISRSNARPGDLVFYLSGRSAYHIAIYAGHGMQYAAATPAHGIRYQAVWSSAVQYGTDWH